VTVVVEDVASKALEGTPEVGAAVETVNATPTPRPRIVQPLQEAVVGAAPVIGIEPPTPTPEPPTPTGRNRTAVAQSAPTSTAVPPLCERAESPAYCVYTVREGDTLSHVAQRFRLGGGELAGWELLAASNKPDITSIDDFIQPGQKLRVPLALGLVHTVLLDESLELLAETFQVPAQTIIDANPLKEGDPINVGDVLFIPNPDRLELPPPPEPTPTPTPERPPGAPTPQPGASRSGFIWPISAAVRITNYMSARHPLGIDLGLSHAAGSPIRAVAAGKVTFAGGDACCSYGLYVIVDHGNGLKTLYAHLSRLSVSTGQQVSQGQTLGPSGSTGYSTGVHLHFEVHLNGSRVNPMNYLP
jgi:murein DD-endopeptidase MepM/ murein hydrolase activator NlpD